MVRLKLPEWFMCKNPVLGLFSVESTIHVSERFVDINKIQPEQIGPIWADDLYSHYKITLSD